MPKEKGEKSNMVRISPSKRQRRKGRFFTGKRTDTAFKRIVQTPDGDILKRRQNGSLYPKDTSILLCRPTKNILAVLKNLQGHDNFDELLWSLIKSNDYFRFLPKYLVEPAKRDIKLKKKARIKAMEKGRYIPSEQRKPENYSAIQEAAAETKRNKDMGIPRDGYYRRARKHP
jgi:hypothetical protein